MPTFELNRLESYDDASLLGELRRIAAQVKSPVLTQSEFDRRAKASASVVRKRFGTWAHALSLAGLADRYSGNPEAKRYLSQSLRTFTDDELLAELRAIAEKLQTNGVTIEQFNQHGTMNAETIRRRFGSWQRAVEKAGLAISNLGRRHSESDYFENLLETWTHYGRQPNYGEMGHPPSRIRAKAYEVKWGTWRKALQAFLKRINADLAEPQENEGPVPSAKQSSALDARKTNSKRSASGSESTKRRDIPLGLRYDVLRRDRFRCMICGASPSTVIGCELHVDHVHPFVLGGLTTIANLRTLCSNCNIGKGAKVEHE